MMSRFGYRFIRARWSGKSDKKYPATLFVVGNDDIGIVTNVTSLIQKETKISLRSISVNTVDGLFQGTLTVLVSEMQDLEKLINKIRVIKGIKSVSRN